MCKIGDIILVTDPKNSGQHIGSHSFVVINDENGEIESISFDFVGLILSSLRTDKDRKRLLKYPANMEIKAESMNTMPHNDFDAVVKVNQLYYFNKNKIDYKVIGSLGIGPFNELITFMQELADHGMNIQQIIDNATDIW